MKNLMMRNLNGIGRGLLIAALLMVGLAVAVPANADIFLLTSDHCTNGCGTAPFGSVTLLQNGTTVDVTVHLNPPDFFVKTGAADFMAFKFNALGVVAGDITLNQNAPKPLAVEIGSFNGDGTGNFAFGIDCPTCGGGASDKFNTDIIFHVAHAVINDLIHTNSLGIVFVADILGSTGNTGPVDVTEGGIGGSIIPEPATLLLLGSGLLGLGLAGGVRRLRRK